MRSFVEKLLFGGVKLKQFIPVRISNDGSKEKVVLKLSATKRVDISQRHSIVSQTPFCLSIFLSKDEFDLADESSLHMLVVENEQTVASFRLRNVHTIKYDHSYIVLYQIVEVRNYRLNFLQREWALRFSFKNKSTSYFERKVYGGLYAYPRKVIVVCYAEKEYVNIFPMDFQCFIPGANIYLLGLRTSNITLDKIIQSRKLVVTDSAEAETDIIYSLGSHHKKPLNIDELPFEVEDSELYKFPIPKFANTYRELELVDYYKSGSHMLLVAKTINSHIIKKPGSSLHHIHFFQFGKSHYDLG